MTHLPVAPEHWRLLPLKLKQRWWMETEYGTRPPSIGLAAAMADALDKALPKPGPDHDPIEDA